MKKELQDKEQCVVNMEREKEGHSRKFEDAMAEKDKMIRENECILQKVEYEIQKQTEELKMYEVQLKQLKAECIKLRAVAESVKEKEEIEPWYGDRDDEQGLGREVQPENKMNMMQSNDDRAVMGFKKDEPRTLGSWIAKGPIGSVTMEKNKEGLMFPLLC